MNARERSLALVVGAIVGALALWSGYQRLVEGPIAELASQRDRLQAKVEDQETQVRRVTREVSKLAVLEARSLPADRQLARSLYQNWLVEAVNRVGFASPNVDSGAIATRKDLYDRLTFTVRGRGDLAQLARFLYDFYRADFLHQVTRLTITPVASTSKLDLSLSIEALVLPGAARRERLDDRRSQRLAHESLANYQPLVERNLFGDGGARLFDPADFAFLTAIVDVDGQPEAWFNLRTTGELVKLRRGQRLVVGDFSGTVEQIDELDLILASDDERWLLGLGESLTQATALPPEF